MFTVSTSEEAETLSLVTGAVLAGIKGSNVCFRQLHMTQFLVPSNTLESDMSQRCTQAGGQAHEQSSAVSTSYLLPRYPLIGEASYDPVAVQRWATSRSLLRPPSGSTKVPTPDQTSNPKPISTSYQVERNHSFYFGPSFTQPIPDDEEIQGSSVLASEAR